MSKNESVSTLNEHKRHWYFQSYENTFGTYADLHFPNWCSAFPFLLHIKNDIFPQTYLLSLSSMTDNKHCFLGTVILCINIGLKINYINTYETLQRQDSSITNTAFICIWTGNELQRTEMFWKREFPNISNQHYWTLDCNCLNTVDSVSTIQVYSHKETFVWDGWIVEWKPFPLLSCQYDCLVRYEPSACSRFIVNKFHVHADIARRKRETKLIYRQKKRNRKANDEINENWRVCT